MSLYQSCKILLKLKTLCGLIYFHYENEAFSITKSKQFLIFWPIALFTVLTALWSAVNLSSPWNFSDMSGTNRSIYITISYLSHYILAIVSYFKNTNFLRLYNRIIVIDAKLESELNIKVPYEKIRKETLNYAIKLIITTVLLFMLVLHQFGKSSELQFFIAVHIITIVGFTYKVDYTFFQCYLDQYNVALRDSVDFNERNRPQIVKIIKFYHKIYELVPDINDAFNWTIATGMVKDFYVLTSFTYYIFHDTVLDAEEYTNFCDYLAFIILGTLHAHPSVKMCCSANKTKNSMYETGRAIENYLDHYNFVYLSTNFLMCKCHYKSMFLTAHDIFAVNKEFIFEVFAGIISFLIMFIQFHEAIG